jgi:hypothetical protein
VGVEAVGAEAAEVGVAEAAGLEDLAAGQAAEVGPGAAGERSLD